MRILTQSNWKQKLPFDNITYKEVKRFSLKLNSYERKIMDVEIDYYRTHFSLLQVMNHFKKLKTDLAKTILIKAVLKRQENILYLPQQLVPYFKKKIKDEFSDFSEFFTILLKKATSKKSTNTIIPLVKAVLGDYYTPALKKLDHYRRAKVIKVVQKPIKPEGYENTARNIIGNLQNDLCLSEIYGRSDIRKNVPISIVDDYGYGEWVSKNVTYGTNRFFLYSNNNRLTDVQLEHEVYFNVYPGYGYFYNTVVNEQSNALFDNGATFLINGWAMYAMCHSKNSAYSHSLLTEGATITYNLLKKNLKTAYDKIYLYLLSLYPKAKAIDYMLDYTQYPGHYMSYVLGEIATELSMQNDFANNPIDYLKTLSTINCGDFFALYSKKMQIKIARSNIVAKVSKKYS